MAIRNGSPDNDLLYGTGNADTLRGFEGDDELYGLDQDDLLLGHAGNDILWADWGNDTVQGGDGDDAIYGGAGIDSLEGGAGDDFIVMNDINYGGFAVANGGTGNDALALFSKSGGEARGGAGIDALILYCLGSSALFADFLAGTITQDGGFGDGVTWSGIERLMVNSYGGDDTVIGGNDRDDLSVGSGSNEVSALGGDDRVYYVATDANTLDGGTGNDTLTVNAAPDSSLYFIIDTGDGSVDDGQLSVISGFETYSAFGGIYNDIASLHAGDDLFQGSLGHDTAFGMDGDDLLLGQGGNDNLSGGDGKDDLRGGAGNDVLSGGENNDRLGGGEGNDDLDAGGGDDRLVVYLGYDTLTGGAGQDDFLFIRNEWSYTTITDFTSGTDRLVFEDSYLQFGPGPGPLDPSLLNIDTAVGPEAQFTLYYNAEEDQTTLLWDPNGDDPSGGRYLIANFEGDVTILASDIFII